MVDETSEVEVSTSVPVSEALRITSLEVDRLFNLYDHRIAFKVAERITILHGPNGVGKTILLRLMSAFFRGYYQEIIKIPFKEVRIEFENGDLIIIRSGRDKRKKGGEIPWLEIFLRRMSGPPAEHKIIINEEVLERRIHELDSVPWLIRRGPNLWLDRQFNEELSSLAAWDRYSSLLPHNRKPGGLFNEDEWLSSYRKQVSVHYIETHRLVRFGAALHGSPRWEVPTQMIPTVRDCAQDLQNRINQVLQSYGRESQTLDQTFPQRLLRGIGSLPVPVIKLQMSELDKERVRLRQMGLLEERVEDASFDVAARPMCQRRLRQSLPDIFVPMGGEWSPTRAQAIPSSKSRSRLRRGRAQGV